MTFSGPLICSPEKGRSFMTWPRCSLRIRRRLRSRRPRPCIKSCCGFRLVGFLQQDLSIGAWFQFVRMLARLFGPGCKAVLKGESLETTTFRHCLSQPFENGRDSQEYVTDINGPQARPNPVATLSTSWSVRPRRLTGWTPASGGLKGRLTVAGLTFLRGRPRRRELPLRVGRKAL
jgi:hypothetical protein